MVKLLHTADWQIGMRFSHVPEVARVLREARLAAARQVVALANAHQVAALLLVGDNFEDNQVDDRTLIATCDLLAAAQMPVYLLPGNHDPLVHGSIYRRPAFARRAPHIHLLETADPLPIPDTEVVLHPAPITAKKSFDDPSACLRVDPQDPRIQVGLVHGSLRIPARYQEDDFPIALDAVERCGLDYLALGHWHGRLEHSLRCAYSGTHEQTKFDERDAGQVLLVELTGHGALPTLTPLPTGTRTWRTLTCDWSLGVPGAVEAVRNELKSLPDAPNTLIRLKVAGPCDTASEQALRELEDEIESRCLYLQCDRTGEISATQLAGQLAEIAAASPLVAQLAATIADTPNPAEAQAARRLLAQLVHEVWR